MISLGSSRSKLHPFFNNVLFLRLFCRYFLKCVPDFVVISWKISMVSHTESNQSQTQQWCHRVAQKSPKSTQCSFFVLQPRSRIRRKTSPHRLSRLTGAQNRTTRRISSSWEYHVSLRTAENMMKLLFAKQDDSIVRKLWCVLVRFGLQKCYLISPKLNFTL